MAVTRRWNKRRLNRGNVDGVAPVVGVYFLLARNGYTNYASATHNLHAALAAHLDDGDIPAEFFRAQQTDSYDDAQRRAVRFIDDYEPYYNVLA